MQTFRQLWKLSSTFQDQSYFSFHSGWNLSWGNSVALSPILLLLLQISAALLPIPAAIGSHRRGDWRVQRQC